jgi:hypothetical protein
MTLMQDLGMVKHRCLDAQARSQKKKAPLRPPQRRPSIAPTDLIPHPIYGECAYAASEWTARRLRLIALARTFC